MKSTSKMFRAFLPGGLILFLAFALAGHAAAQTWTELAPTGGPPPFRGHGASTVYDADSNRWILFGGATAGPKLNDVWVLTNANGLDASMPQWTQLFPTGGPPTARANQTAVYDAANNRMVIFGGCAGGCTPTLNDVWVLSNANGLDASTPQWTQLFPTGGPPATRNNHRAAYDPLTNRMIMFGGQDGGGSLATVFEEVWVLTNANGLEAGTPTWSQLLPTGTPASGTIGYYLAFMVYDSAANRMTIFGGLPKSPPAASTDRNSVWVLSNANGLGTPAWTNTVAQGAAGSPPNQAAGAFVNDTANNIATLYNFLSSLPRTWTLSHVNGLGGSSVWTEIFPGGGSPGSPHGLNSPAYDAASNRMIVFTNSATQANTNEVWVLTDANGVPPNNPPVAQCQNVTVSTSTGTCSATASVNNNSSDPDGDPITLAQSPSGPYGLGATNVTLTVTDDQGASDSCTATVAVVDNQAPSITCPAPQTIECTGPGGATASFGPQASDNCPGITGISCAPPSGSTFQLGTTGASCSATDGSGNSTSCTTSVTVIDTTPPAITCPAPQVIDSTGPSGAIASFSATATDTCSGAIGASCTPPSGSTFPVGSTSITCSATDVSGNTSTCGFTVTVLSPSQMTSNLTAAVTVLEFQQAVKLLGNIVSQINAGNNTAACNQLNAFINQVQAQSGKQLTVAQANQLIASANQIKAALGCP